MPSLSEGTSIKKEVEVLYSFEVGRLATERTERKLLLLLVPCPVQTNYLFATTLRPAGTSA